MVFKLNIKKTEKSKVKECKLKPVSIYPVGITDKDEEIKNLGHKKISKKKKKKKLNKVDIICLELLIQHQENQETTRKSGYIIKPSSYTVTKTNDPEVPNNDLGIGWLGGKLRDSKCIYRFRIYTKRNYYDRR